MKYNYSHDSVRLPKFVLFILQVRGIKTNISFLQKVLKHPAFLTGDATTAFISKYWEELMEIDPHELTAARGSVLANYMADMVRFISYSLL